MALFLIGYDLDKPNQDYESLFEAIKSLGNWWHHLDSTWLVESTKDFKEVRDLLKQHIKKNDKLLVYDVTGRPAAWAGFNEKASKWLKEH
jgi:hypothetical protein